MTDDQAERLIEVLMRLHHDLHKDLLKLSSDLDQLSIVSSHIA